MAKPVCKNNEEIVVRAAVKEDMTAVFGLIKELSEFEKLEDQVKIDENVLMKDGFDTANPAFHCLVAIRPNNQIVGYALYYICYSTWLGKSIFLEDLYVKQECRKQGIGKRLFVAVAQIAHNGPSKRLDFHVLSWNPAIDFYKSLGAINLTSTEKWQLFRLGGEALEKIV